jgi:hypothetical protein
MNRIFQITAGLGVATLASTCLAAAPATAATKNHTLVFTTRTIASNNKGTFLTEADRILVGGKTVGFGANSCVFDFTTSQASCDVAVALANGVLYAHVVVNGQTGASQGVVTGGTRAYRGAKGVAKGLPGRAGSDTVITVIYHS